MEAHEQLILVVSEPGRVELNVRDLPRPKDDEVLVLVRAVGLCGTDLEIIDGTIDPEYVSYPISIGHEFAGEVVMDPSGEFAEGTTVVVEGIIPCWRCRHCREGKTNLCTTYDELGFTRDGGCSRYVSVPRQGIHPIASSHNIATASLIEPGAVVYQGLRRIKPTVGMRSLVIGDGTIALLAVHLLGLWSPASISVVGKRAAQCELVLEAGAASFSTELKADDFDLVIEASGSVSGAANAFESVRRGGKVLLLGLTPHGAVYPLSVDDVVNKDLEIQASFGYTASAWSRVVELFNCGKYSPGFLVTHRYRLADWEEAINNLRQGEGVRGKILLIP
ncbi:MAG: zinc-dependent alcohol dehydrogenase [Ferrimicrobium acidiphilum]